MLIHKPYKHCATNTFFFSMHYFKHGIKTTVYTKVYVFRVFKISLPNNFTRKTNKEINKRSWISLKL